MCTTCVPTQTFLISVIYRCHQITPGISIGTRHWLWNRLKVLASEVLVNCGIGLILVYTVKCLDTSQLPAINDAWQCREWLAKFSRTYCQAVEMDRMSDYDIRPKPKVWTGSPNECRTFGRMLHAMMNVCYWWLVSTLNSQKCRSKYYVSTWAHTHCLRWETR